MGFKQDYPDFATIEDHIRRAHLERSVAIAAIFAKAITATIDGVKDAVRALSGPSRRDHAAIEADPFLKRSVPRY